MTWKRWFKLLSWWKSTYYTLEPRLHKKIWFFLFFNRKSSKVQSLNPQSQNSTDIIHVQMRVQNGQQLLYYPLFSSNLYSCACVYHSVASGHIWGLSLFVCLLVLCQCQLVSNLSQVQVKSQVSRHLKTSKWSKNNKRKKMNRK